MTALPMYKATVIHDDDQKPCDECPLGDIDKNCTRVPLRRFDREGHIAEPDDPIDLLVVGDPPTKMDERNKGYFRDEDGKTIMAAIKELGVNSFALIPAVRCYPLGQVDHFVLNKKYRNERRDSEDKPLDIAKEGVEFCKDYVTRARATYQPKMTLGMGPLASEALGKGGNIIRLRSVPLYPNPGIAAASRKEGTVFTWDRAYARVSKWAQAEMMLDIEEKLPNLRETGYAHPRGDDRTVEQVWLTTVEDVRAFVDECLTDEDMRNELLAFDFETMNMSKSTKRNRILNVGLSFTGAEDYAYVIPLQHPETPFSSDELDEVFDILGELWAAKDAPFYGFLAHNAQFETEIIKVFWDIWVGEAGGKPILDTLIIAYLHNENRHKKGIKKPYSLETLALEYMGFRWYTETGIKTRRDRLAEEPLDKVNRYVGFDAAVTARLFNQLVEWMQDEESEADLVKVAAKLYGPATLYTSDMTLVGQKIDTELLRMLRAKDSEIVSRVEYIRNVFADSPLVEEAIESLNHDKKRKTGAHGLKGVFETSASKAASQFNMNSPDHLRSLFWDVMKLKGADKSVDKTWQNMHKDRHELVALFQEYQQLSKLDQAYLSPIAEFIQKSDDGRLHPSFNLAQTVSGRLSASEPNCYDAETEILTWRGWVPFPELRDDDAVAQWWQETDTVDFVVPEEVVRRPYDGPMVTLNNQHIDLDLTPNHRCPLVHRKSGEVRVFRADEYKEDYRQLHASRWEGGSVSLTEAEVALICAAQADGYWRKDVNGAMEWSFVKQRKVDRLRWALDQTKVRFKDHPKKVRDKQGRAIYAPASPGLELVEAAIGKEKTFKPEWVLHLDRKTLDLFVKEVNFWDGCFTRNNQYTSIVKDNVDAVQIAMVLSGIRATVNPHSKAGWSIYQTARTYSLTTNVERGTYDNEGRTVYCVAVPSSFVVVRRNGKPCISGNTQNVPRSDSKAKKQIKSLYCAPPGKVLCQVDFSQAEVRWLGILSGDDNLAAKYATAEDLKVRLLKEPDNKDVQRALLLEGDLHMSTAIGMYKLKDEDCLDASGERTKYAKDKRQAAKAVCFGLIYGKHYKSLARDLGIEDEEAEEAVNKWMAQFPKAAEWLEMVDETIPKTCVSVSPFGRWRRLAEAAADDQSVANRAKRQARNTPIQSAASDFCIYAACKLREALRVHPDPKLREETLIINTVHDSLICEIPADPDVMREYARMSKDILINPRLVERDFGIVANVPLAVDYEVGLNWGNMHDYDLTEESLAQCLYDAEVLRSHPPGTVFSDLKGKGLLYAERSKKAAS